MDKKEFYREQAEKFLVYFKKFMPAIFAEWAESKDFSEKDKGKIWQIIARLTS